MIGITKHANLHSLESKTTVTALIDFLHTHLDQFRDSKSAIGKAIDYAFSTEAGKGGYVLLGWNGEQLAGAVVMNKTGMDEYIPGWLLVYIAVNSGLRGQGIGSALMREAFDNCDGGIALHVEYDNPAKRLYERLGFTSKYAEMRWQKG
ncbi:MAG: GNAT family N-acetyltransferase [Candidatus Syntrophosphaera sp.]|nr:GNAT family N-acetyltransferase [Candidatus Syntrophosphaera sp.]